MKKMLNVKRIFVSRRSLIEGNRIEKSEQEMTSEQMDAFKSDFTDRWVNMFGFVKKSD